MGSTISKKAKKKEQIIDYVSWFEIPALNLQRAVTFYNSIYGIDMQMTHMNGYAMAFFPTDKGIGGALVMGQGSTPGETGTLVYLNGGKDLSNPLSRVEQAGGRIVLGKTFINEEAGYFALFIDTEGNKLALHSKN